MYVESILRYTTQPQIQGAVSSNLGQALGSANTLATGLSAPVYSPDLTPHSVSGGDILSTISKAIAQEFTDRIFGNHNGLPQNQQDNQNSTNNTPSNILSRLMSELGNLLGNNQNRQNNPESQSGCGTKGNTNQNLDNTENSGNSMMQTMIELLSKLVDALLNQQDTSNSASKDTATNKAKAERVKKNSDNTGTSGKAGTTGRSQKQAQKKSAYDAA